MPFPGRELDPPWCEGHPGNSAHSWLCDHVMGNVSCSPALNDDISPFLRDRHQAIRSGHATMAQKAKTASDLRRARKRPAKPANRAAATARTSRRAHGAERDARPTWSGSLRLALVTVPVQLYPAIRICNDLP